MSGHYGGDPNKWDGGTNNPHVARYLLARGWVYPGETVLDAACCTGYGSHLISYLAKKVYGYEVDEGCIADAKNLWQRPNISFQVKDLNTCELPNVDVLISLETMEHLNDLNHFLDQVDKHVKRAIIMTVPLGGTSWSYTEEERKLPAGECNDFNNSAHVQSIFNARGWTTHTDFNFGYSGFFVFYKKQPKRLTNA